MTAKSDYEWLISEQADDHFQRVSESNRLLNALQALRSEIGEAKARLIIQQIELRNRAKPKFAQARHMFFSGKSLEQATSEPIANLKAKRFAGKKRIADICCGIGGDLLAIARVANQVDAFDVDEITSLFCQKNCTVNGLTNTKVLTSAAEGLAIGEYDAWHIDPDRRDTGSRTIHPEKFAPHLSTIRALLHDNPNAAVKMAPATSGEADWLEEAELHWIGHNRACQQLVAYFGDLAEYPGKRVASILGDRETRTIVNQSDDQLKLTTTIGEYVYEPHAAILAAQCSGELAKQHDLMAIIPGGGYLTSDRLCLDPAMSSFRVIETIPFHEKKVRQLLRKMDAGTVEVKKRAVELDPSSLQSKWKGKGTRRFTVIIFRRNQSVAAIIAQRLS